MLAAQAATLTVQPGGDLAEAVRQASPGDVVEVKRGMYRVNLLIDKPLTLRGLDRPTLSGGNEGDTIRVTSPDVVIEGLIVRDSGDSLKNQNAGIYVYPGAHRAIVRRCDLTYNLFGLWIEKANDVLIEHNTITGKREYGSSQRGNGIQLYNTKGARIFHNNISFVRDALYVDVSHHAVFRGNRLHHSRYGTHYMNSYHNLWEDNDSYYNRGGLALMEVRDQVVRGNRAWGNSDHGIMLRTLQDSVIEDNIVAGNSRGFFIYDVEYIKLNRNLVVDNVVGVHLAAGSTRNEVEGNDFISNREQVRYVGARDERWGTQGGNHWSNYVGWDRDGDGRGDVPYEANDMVDRLTWRYPAIKLLLASPAVQALRLVGQQFPVLRVPSVVDPHPRMQPGNPKWSEWRGKHFPGQ
ncbi:nitrous oxide reductase family maturation protein NosD [Aquabacterium sp.]|uniref:nitrous oxide reductase family maturation protein NosD n=1 Tax=Aquabacterium sp. TaxID=1872578 RepID=UPI002603EB88|nr:nitrous oxide reductase family maturation protein NosD [Aquabacterium sp.]MDD2977521.1 nitrous oxide reductase family maturation protein NosD [Aquabacterium sp.]